jgi:FkbM family methyltransferase
MKAARVSKQLLSGAGVGPDTSVYRRLRTLYWESRSVRGARTYSQFGEDAVLSTFFSGRGSYVDVGAGRPIRGSNTYALYRRGWRGVLLEPIRENARDLRWVRRGDSVVNALCGRGPGTATFFQYDPYEYSTISHERMTELAREGIHPQRQHTLAVVALNQLGISAKPSEASLLSIDVEGAEMDVLEGNDWNAYLPSVICIEELASPLLTVSSVSTFLAERGYSLNSRIRISSIYVHRDWHGASGVN